MAPPGETPRGVYEIPPGERFDPKFTRQYLSREGRIYQAYLERHHVRERASLRVDANREGACFALPGNAAPLV